jgi:cytochrome c-type biogenesis protein CcsB
MIASYAALLLGCLVAIAYLIFSSLTSFSKNQTPLNSKIGETQPSTNQSRGLVLETTKNSWSNFSPSDPLFNFLDNLSYRTIGIGFCFLTLGILSGAVWANETWGTYWSWDPKETWAFLTWLTFATYLHSRLVGGWTGSKPAVIASFGFFVVWICYLGVNLLGQGLHSYGFLGI